MDNRAERIELTPSQVKAWKSFVGAYKKCKSVGIIFHTVLSSLYALNGDNIVRIHDDSHLGDLYLYDEDVLNPDIDDAGFNGWADDDHFVELKGE